MLQGAAQPPPLPLLSRLYSSFCSLCVQIFARCVYPLHPSCAICVVIFLSAGGVRQCVCVFVCVRACLSQSTTASVGHHAHVCVCVSSTVWSHGRLQQYWALGSASSAGGAQSGNICGRSCPWPVVHISLMWSDLNLCDPLVGSTSPPSWLTEHVFLNNDYDFVLEFDVSPVSCRNCFWLRFFLWICILLYFVMLVALSVNVRSIMHRRLSLGTWGADRWVN